MTQLRRWRWRPRWPRWRTCQTSSLTQSGATWGTARAKRFFLRRHWLWARPRARGRPNRSQCLSQKESLTININANNENDLIGKDSIIKKTNMDLAERHSTNPGGFGDFLFLIFQTLHFILKLLATKFWNIFQGIYLGIFPAITWISNQIIWIISF